MRFGMRLGPFWVSTGGRRRRRSTPRTRSAPRPPTARTEPARSREAVSSVPATPRSEPRDDLLYGTVRNYRAEQAGDGFDVYFTFATDDGQDIEVHDHVQAGDETLKVADGDRFTANKGLSDMGDYTPHEVVEKAAKIFNQVNAYEPWKRAEFRSDPDSVQFAAQCGWRFDDNDVLRNIERA